MNLPICTLDVIAASIELTHCYSLVHDDLPAMDNDDVRRGKPSCHRAFDEATAILVGDALQSLAIDLLLTTLPHTLTMPQVVDVTLALVKASGPYGMVSGQSLDLSELTNPNLSTSRLREIHQLKTGCLISACINMVLAAVDAPRPLEVTGLRQFAHHLGLAFQMQDDYLDAYGEGNCLGKGRSSDAANEKITFGVLYGQEELSRLITTSFEQAKQGLAPFGARAHDLYGLIESLHHRMTTTIEG
jgi:farnesyl diphosphate synthase